MLKNGTMEELGSIIVLGLGQDSRLLNCLLRGRQIYLGKKRRESQQGFIIIT